MHYEHGKNKPINSKFFCFSNSFKYLSSLFLAINCLGFCMPEKVSFYGSLEEKYYSVVGKLGPIKNLVAAIDRVFPSFLLLIIAVVAIAAYFLVPFLMQSTGTDFKLRLVNENGAALQGSVQLNYSGKIETLQTNNSGFISKAIPRDSSVVFLAAANGYNSVNGTIIVGEKPILLDVVLAKKSRSFDRKVIFALESGERIKGKIIQAKLSCANSAVKPEQEIVSSNNNGELAFIEPVNCGTLTLTVFSPAEFKQKSFAIVDPITVVAMEYNETPKAIIALQLVDASGIPLGNIAASVSLVQNGAITQTTMIEHGHGIIDALPGKYNLLVQDNALAFAMLDKIELDLNAGTRLDLNVRMSSDLKGFVFGKVLDNSNGKAIANASIELRDLKDDLLASAKTGSNGEFRLPVVSALFLFLTASAEGYLPLQQSVDLDAKAIEIKLEKATEFNSGIVEVSVFDPGSAPVENAVVTLHDANSMEIAPYGQKVSDANGIARFAGVKAGKYIAVAEKYPYHAESIEQETSISETANFFVWFFAVESSLSLKAVDESGNAIENAIVEVFDLNGQKIDSVELQDGRAFYSTRADKRVFLVFSHPDYLQYYSESFNLLQLDFVEIKAVMRKAFFGDAPKANFLGVFNEFGEKVFDLESGKNYSAKIELLVPSTRAFDSAELHFRVGSAKSIEDDELQIVAANAGIATVISGKMFNEPKSEQTDFAIEITGNFPAKWVNATIDYPEAAVYAVSIDLSVSEQAAFGAMLPMFYRAVGIANGVYYRDPEDDVLGHAKETQEKQALYAKTVALQQYFKRAERACYGKLCLIANSQEAKSGEFLEEPFELFKGIDYNVLFTVLNNSSQPMENVSIEARNYYFGKERQDLKITGFEINSAKKQFSDFATENAAIGTLQPNSNIEGKLAILPLADNYTALQFKVTTRNAGSFVFNVFFDAFDKRLMKINAVPEQPIALAESKLLLFAIDPETGRGIANALFTLDLQAANGGESQLQKRADSNGLADFFLLAMKPGSRIIVNAFSTRFTAKPLVLELGNNVLSFSPSRATIAIDTNEGFEKKSVFKVINSIAQSVRVESIELSLEQPVFFEESEMRGFLKQQKPEFAAFEQKNIELFLVKLRESVFIPNNTRLNGALLVKAKSQDKEWAFDLPFEVIVNSVQFAGNESCLALSEGEWIAELEKNQFYKNIELRNNCKLGNNAINVYDLSAVAEWDSNVSGNLEIALLDARGNEINTVPVQSSENPQVFLSQLAASGKAKAILKFIPKTGYWGQKAEFSVMFSGISPSVQGNTVIESGNIVSGSLLLFNPAQCVIFKPAPSETLKLGALDRNKSFEIDATKCGDVSIEFSLCENNEDCSGGTEEGGIFVSPDYFVLSKKNQAKKINVSRSEIPGEYGVTVSARVKDVAFKDFAEILVEIQPEKSEQLFLDKYSFYLNENSGMDSATITNKKLSEIVRVEASVCDWQAMLKDEKRHFNFGDAGGGLMPAKLDGSRELFGKAMATSHALASVDHNSVMVAVEAARKAYEKAKIAEDDAQKAVDGAQKALEQAQKMAQMVAMVDSLIAITESLNQKAVDVACGGLGATAEVQLFAVIAASTVLKSLVGLIQNDTQKMLEKMTDGQSAMASSLSNAEMMKESAEDGKKELMPKDAADVSYSNKMAATSFENARDYGKKAASENKDGESKLDEAREIADTVIGPELVKAGAQVPIIVVANALYLSILKGAISPCLFSAILCEKASCAAAFATQEILVVSSVAVQLAQITTQVAATQAAVEKAKQLSSDAMDSAADARQAEIDAVIQLRRAVSVAQSMTETSFKASQAQSADSNTVNKMVSLYPFIGFIGGSFDGGIYSELDEPCSHKIEGYVIDYITDLRNDVSPVELSVQDVSAYINKKEAKVFGDYNAQTIGIVFQNNGFASEKPAFGIATIKFKKHEHDYIQEVPLGYSDFGPFRVQDNSVETVEQKFHVRFVSRPQKQVFVPETSTGYCAQGIRFGYNGEAALPRIKLNWGWDDLKGISATGCQKDNNDYSFCDAAQFNIMLAKKLFLLQEFLEKNSASLKCPKNSVESQAQEVIEKISSRKAQDGQIGIEKISAAVKAGSVSVVATVKNNSGESKNPTVIFSLSNPGSTLDDETCIGTNSVAAGATATVGCSFSGLSGEGYYSIKTYLQPDDKYAEQANSVQFDDEENIDLKSSLAIAFRANEDAVERQCWLQKTTDLFDGKSALEYFVQDSNPAWTSEVKNTSGLANLLRFKAMLIEDNYNDSFVKDFADYYSNVRFFDTQTFFRDPSAKNTLNKYYFGENISFNNSFFDSTRLSGAGEFGVDVNIDFGNSWNLFAGNAPSAEIKTIFGKKAEPFPPSPFYYLPFDSEVGIKNGALERKEYGTAYETSGTAIKFNETDFDKMPESAKTKALKKAKARLETDLNAINANALSRGNIFSIALQDANANAEIVFSPSYAVPVAMVVTEEKPEAAASVAYQFFRGAKAENAGSSLAYWTGMGNCTGFLEQNAKDAFDFSPDRRAKPSDRIPDYNKSYAFDLGNIEQGGNAWFKTIVFLPLDGEFAMQAASANIKLGSLGEPPGQRTTLRGIPGMNFNNKGSNNAVKTISDAFALVESGNACVSSNGLSMAIWWNQQALEKATVDGKSIETIEKNLGAQSACPKNQ